MSIVEKCMKLLVDLVNVKLAMRPLANLLIELLLDPWDQLANLDRHIDLGLPLLKVFELLSIKVIRKKLLDEPLHGVMLLGKFENLCHI